MKPVELVRRAAAGAEFRPLAVLFLSFAACHGHDAPKGQDSAPEDTGEPICTMCDDSCSGRRPPEEDTADCGDRDGYTPAEGDCDDDDPEVNPGAIEVCNGLNDDCDEEIDEGLGFLAYRDADADGFGTTTDFLEICELPDGYTLIGGDCDDSNAAISPGAVELCNELDDDCDGLVDEDCPDSGG